MSKESEYWRDRANFWGELERAWRETKEYCHQKVVEIKAIRTRMLKWKKQATN